VGAYAQRPLPGVGATAWWSSVDGDETLVLPDGCVDVLWIGDHLAVAGPDRRARRHRHADGTEVGGVRLDPGRAAAVLGTDVEDLVDQVVDLDQVWGTRTARRAHDLVGGSSPGAPRAAAIETLLGDALHQRPPQRDETAPVVARWLGAGASIAAIADELGCSERTLHRHARRWYGYGPKHLARVLRFQRALATARTGTALATVAASAGYADQPHLAREVRDLTGATMGALLPSTEPAQGSSA
jgi:AraC-like DNA-binding protein